VKHRIAMNADQFSFQQSATGIRGERELSTSAMRSIVDSITLRKQKYDVALKKEVSKYFFTDSVSITSSPQIRTQQTSKLVYIRVLDKIKSAKNVIQSN